MNNAVAFNILCFEAWVIFLCIFFTTSPTWLLPDLIWSQDDKFYLSVSDIIQEVSMKDFYLVELVFNGNAQASTGWNLIQGTSNRKYYVLKHLMQHWVFSVCQKMIHSYKVRRFVRLLEQCMYPTYVNSEVCIHP